ncbi:Pectinesterase inhibitor [Artemisia annua]|uniref:pectinesterase n=1 Tax=Artemisia annua TaxID=35608 RepID=A0A2U1KE29_ARTAN|nr:Pectinesterase inhibitor [Artemisia annua]
MEEESHILVKPKVNSSSDDDIEESTSTSTSLQPQSPTRRRTTAVIITLTILFVIIGAILAAGAYDTRANSSQPDDTRLSSIKATRSIKAVCAVTHDPPTCVTDLTTLDSTNLYDPELIFNLTLSRALTELVRISSLPKTLISKSTDLRAGSALRDCVSLFDDAVSQLSQAIEAMKSGEDGRILNEEKVGDLKTWISSAMSDQETCTDGLEEMGSSDLEEVKMKVKLSSEFMSDCLAVLDNLEKILKVFGLKLH